MSWNRNVIQSAALVSDQTGGHWNKCTSIAYRCKRRQLGSSLGWQWWRLSNILSYNFIWIPALGVCNGECGSDGGVILGTLKRVCLKTRANAVVSYYHKPAAMMYNKRRALNTCTADWLKVSPLLWQPAVVVGEWRGSRLFRLWRRWKTLGTVPEDLQCSLKDNVGPGDHNNRYNDITRA